MEAVRVGGASVGFRLCVQSRGNDPSSSPATIEPGTLLSSESLEGDRQSEGNGERAVAVHASTPLIPHLPVLYRVLAHSVDEGVPLEVLRCGMYVNCWRRAGVGLILAYN